MKSQVCFFVIMTLALLANSDDSSLDAEVGSDPTDDYLLDGYSEDNPRYIDVDEFEDLLATQGGDLAGEMEYEYNDPYVDQRVIKPMDRALSAIYGIIAIVGLIANGVVFFVVFAGSEIRKTVTALYVVQLAFADSIFLCTLPIFGMQKLTKNWTLGGFTCSFVTVIKFQNYFAGIFFLTAMSVDRYIAVAYSTKAHQLRTIKRTVVVSSIVWVASLLMTIPAMMYAVTDVVGDDAFCRMIFPGAKILTDDDIEIDLTVPSFSGDSDEYDYYSGDDDDYDEFGSSTATNTSFPASNYTYEDYPGFYDDNSTIDRTFECSHDDKGPVYISWVLVNFFIGFLIPFSIISISYILILKRLQTSEEKIASMTGKRAVNMRKRVTRMVAALVICFVICWLPYHLFALSKIKGFRVSVPVCVGLEQFFVAFGFSNSAINPILYTFLGRNFRERLRESINRTKRRLRRGSMASATGHITRSHSDHRNNSIPRRVANIVGLRRNSSKGLAGCEVECSSDQARKQSLIEEERTKYGIRMLDMSKKRESKSTYWKYDAGKMAQTV